jgi:YD repeat-containing protein
VRPVVARIEAVPLAKLRAAVWVTAFHSREARMYANVRAFELGIAYWVDGGVRPQQSLARASVFFPVRDGAACYECSWSAADYEALGAEASCVGGGAGVPPTRSPVWLCAQAAAMMAQQVQRGLLSADPHGVAMRYVYDAAGHRAWQSRLTRGSGCRFNHRRLAPQPLPRKPENIALGELLARGPVSAPGTTFARVIRCFACGAEEGALRLACRVGGCCRRCGGRLGCAATDVVHTLESGPGEMPLAGLGFETGDFVRAGDALFELTEDMQ